MANPARTRGAAKTNLEEGKGAGAWPVFFYSGSWPGFVPHHEHTGFSNIILHSTAFEHRLASIRGGWSGRKSAGYTNSFSSAISRPMCMQYFNFFTCQIRSAIAAS